MVTGQPKSVIQTKINTTFKSLMWGLSPGVTPQPSPAQQQLPIQSTPVIKLCENCWVVKRGANSSRNNDYLQRKVEISGRFCLLTFQSVEQTVLLFLFLAATPVNQLAGLTCRQGDSCSLDRRAVGDIGRRCAQWGSKRLVFILPSNQTIGKNHS